MSPAGLYRKSTNVYTILQRRYPLEEMVELKGIEPYRIGDHDRDKSPDLMVKFRRSDVIDILPEGDEVPVTVSGTVGLVTLTSLIIMEKFLMLIINSSL
jgi:hypothetical protein